MLACKKHEAEVSQLAIFAISTLIGSCDKRDGLSRQTGMFHALANAEKS